MRSLLSRDVTCDAPPILLTDREDMRVAVYLAKSIATLTLQPKLISVSVGTWMSLCDGRCGPQWPNASTHVPILTAY